MSADDELEYRRIGYALRDTIVAALPAWIDDRYEHHTGRPWVALDERDAVVSTIVADVTDRLTALAEASIDRPMSGPLEILRSATNPLAAALDASGRRPPPRDPFDERTRPDDRWSLGPMAFSELGDAVHDAGIRWGAAKAYLHKQQRSDQFPPPPG